MPPRSALTMKELEDKVRRLEGELYMARVTIIDLMPPEFAGLLDEQVTCVTFREVRDWANHAVDGIIEIAARTENPAGREWDGRMRVRCPLCNQKPQSPYDEGFLLDEGLRRHLLGTYNSRPCSVFAAAHEMALDRARKTTGH